jgi:hypothetical protein
MVFAFLLVRDLMMGSLPTFRLVCSLGIFFLATEMILERSPALRRQPAQDRCQPIVQPG